MLPKVLNKQQKNQKHKVN